MRLETLSKEEGGGRRILPGLRGGQRGDEIALVTSRRTLGHIARPEPGRDMCKGEDRAAHSAAKSLSVLLSPSSSRIAGSDGRQIEDRAKAFDRGSVERAFGNVGNCAASDRPIRSTASGVTLPVREIA